MDFSKSPLSKRPKKVKVRKRRIKFKSDSRQTQADKLWAELIKLRAGGKCEYTGKTDNLHAHHLAGKSTYRLRYDLDNGMCLNGGIHKFVAHRQDRQHIFRHFVKRVRGADIFENLEMLRRYRTKSDLGMIILWLKGKIALFNEGNF